MSFEIDGVLVQPDHRAKERKLYQIIASRESEIQSLNARIAEKDAEIARIIDEGASAREELRRLRARERRRLQKRREAGQSEEAAQ